MQKYFDMNSAGEMPSIKKEKSPDATSERAKQLAKETTSKLTPEDLSGLFASNEGLQKKLKEEIPTLRAFLAALGNKPE